MDDVNTNRAMESIVAILYEDVKQKWKAAAEVETEKKVSE